MPDELTRGALEGLARLRRKGLVSDYHSPENVSCRCHECWGLALSPTRLRVVTMGPPAEPVCEGRDMCCICLKCTKERGARKAAPPIRQPWDVRPLRRAA